MSEDKTNKDIKKSEESKSEDSQGDRTCCYFVDPCGCYVDPCCCGCGPVCC